MVRKERSVLLLSLIIGLAAALIWTGILEASTAGAEQQVAVQLQPPPPDDEDLEFIAFFTDELPIEISDLSGNIVAEGTQIGEAVCNRSKCSHKIEVALAQSDVFAVPYAIEYRFTDRQALDPVRERAVVAGTGTAGSNGEKQRFLFTATFQNNFGGTVTARYEASIPEFSFVITSRGSMLFSSR